MGYKNKRIVLLALFLCFATAVPLFSQPSAGSEKANQSKWTIMIYAQADLTLNSFAIKNLQSMANVGSSENIKIIVQWNQPNKKGVWRYKINKNEIELIETREKRKNFSEDLIDFSKFVADKFSAENYIFIFWSHGSGILDPRWDRLNYFSIMGSCATAEGDTLNSGPAKKAILFDIENKTYLKNHEFQNALSNITKNIIGKKFAIIGMDACFMAMFEVFYQIRNFADYSVSSEEVELAQGWNYEQFLNFINCRADSISSKDIAKNIVLTFKNLYQNETRFYTQSAINLKLIDLLKNNIDLVVYLISQCKKNSPASIKKMIRLARQNCFQLSVSCYVDLLSFYTELQKVVDDKTLKTALDNGIELIKKTVIENVSSKYFSRARGISIYFPFLADKKNKIDSSYLKTEFAQKSLWLKFLKEQA
jgi:hypothetical protein